ncbi:MAG: hypothetical protein HY833_03295 [Candidatus Aenigmarchaeota archaeon]|nr:hypothetical protein [Candidatus Aenigmarchaeota archaeon]
MGMKGQIPVLEMITVTVILFVSFGIFFPERNFDNRWQEADVATKGRDAMITMDRVNSTSKYSSDLDALNSFLNKTIPNNIIYWTTIEGTAQSNIIVACNCTTKQIGDLTNYIGRLKLNDREILLDIRPSALSPIQKSNVLIIWGRTDLGAYKTDILNYMKDGNGVIGMADAAAPDASYTEIFGLKTCTEVFGAAQCANSASTQIDFRYTTNASKPSFLTQKYFFHLPIRDLANLTVFPSTVETKSPAGAVITCPNTQVFGGNLTFKSASARYWICNSTHVFMDTNNTIWPDTILREKTVFSVRDPATGGSYNFSMSYIDAGGNRTYMSFKPNPMFRFDDVNFKSPAVLLYPSDRDDDKVISYDGSYPNGRPIPTVTVNNSLTGRAIWSSDFLSVNPGHDRKLMMASMVLAASKKRTIETTLGDLRISGAVTPYVSVVNRDMMEIYQFNLGLGYPF